MIKKIVAIGGGENGRIKSDGTYSPYETKQIDMEIINLTEKKHPNFLFLGHSQNDINSEESYFHVMQNIYGNIFGCECQTIKKHELKDNIYKVQQLINWADIIYEGGGDTKGMLELWLENCWFKTCSSDSLKLQLKDNTAPMISLNCLNFINAFFTPHCNVSNSNTNRLQHMKESLKNSNLVGLGMSNCCAIEIIDDKYRLLTEDASNYNIESYGIKTYWKDNKYIEKYIDKSNTFKSLADLLSKN